MTLVMTATVSIVAVIALAVAGLGLVYAAGARANNGADAAALAAAVATYPRAGVSSPQSAAADAAFRNGVRLRSCRCPVDGRMELRSVSVVVSTDVNLPFFGGVEVRRSASAEFDPWRWLGR